MKRITFIFIVLSLNCLSGYVLGCPLSLYFFSPSAEGMILDPISQYVLIAIPMAIALPIVVGDFFYRLCCHFEKTFDEKRAKRFAAHVNGIIDFIVRICLVLMLIWACMPPIVRNLLVDKRNAVFDEMHRRYRGWSVDEGMDVGEIRQINNFKGVILQNAGPDGIWDTCDDIIRLEGVPPSGENLKLSTPVPVGYSEDSQ